MSYQENRIVAYLISAVLGVGLYSYYVMQKYQEGLFNSQVISSIWGRAILVIIGVQIVLSILAAIVVSIVQAVITREEQPALSDERDHLIDLKASRVSYSVFGVGFLVAMITLAIGWSPLVMFNIIVYSIFGAGIIGYITQLLLYRKGV